MNIKQLVTAPVLLAASYGAFANGICDKFELYLKNDSADDLVISSIHLSNAQFEPGHLDILKSNSAQKILVNHANKDAVMEAKLKLHTVSLPSKKVTLRFNLEDKGAYCAHSDQGSSGDLPFEQQRYLGGIEYKLPG